MLYILKFESCPVGDTEGGGGRVALPSLCGIPEFRNSGADVGECVQDADAIPLCRFLSLILFFLVFIQLCVRVWEIVCVCVCGIVR